ncbi:MAG: hypothetical protein HC896_19160 [Bacteroidales bacterium]|nr:hypothetical protein [Bacteroidales bacterium]
MKKIFLLSIAVIASMAVFAQDEEEYITHGTKDEFKTLFGNDFPRGTEAYPWGMETSINAPGLTLAHGVRSF